MARQVLRVACQIRVGIEARLAGVDHGALLMAAPTGLDHDLVRRLIQPAEAGLLEILRKED